LEGGMDLIFPIPFLEDSRSVRSSLFFDFGNVFSDGCKSYETNCSEFDLSELRYSLGLGVTWITALGPMSFAISSVFGDDVLDETETFQFEIGNQF
jgi:outer membrane protein insertion porin family